MRSVPPIGGAVGGASAFRDREIDESRLPELVRVPCGDCLQNLSVSEAAHFFHQLTPQSFIKALSAPSRDGGVQLECSDEHLHTLPRLSGTNPRLSPVRPEHALNPGVMANSARMPPDNKD